MKQIFELEAILQPITGEEPCGPYLFYEPIYDAIQEARREEDASLPQGVWEHELKQADWNNVLSLCRETLGQRSKDLQIAAWGVEAATALYGVEGLFEGIAMLRAVAERFWEEVHPKIQVDDPEVRHAPFDWCDTVLVDRLRQSPLSEKTPGDTNVFRWIDWINAEYREQVQQRQKASKPVEAKTAIFRSVDATPAVYYLGFYDTLSETKREITLLQELLNKKTGDTATVFSRLVEEIDALSTIIGRWLTERKGVDPAVFKKKDNGGADMTETESMNEETMQPTVNAAPNDLAVPFRSGVNERDEAYALLERAAAILVRCEPHSPVPYLAHRLAAWKDVSLDELMEELAKRKVEYAMLLKLFPDVG